jgi:GPH family glycoside/pentoside/hexuronide:cation symporter
VVTEDMKNWIFVSITLVPALSCLVSVVPFLFFSIPED